MLIMTSSLLMLNLLLLLEVYDQKGSMILLHIKGGISSMYTSHEDRGVKSLEM